MAVSTHTFQAPKGTRDFYPHDLAVRRYIESVWREVSINHGFDEIDGPTFEHLDLYTIKSGPGIESELFSFRRSGGDTDYALRPEFTPTLARMYAAQAGSLAKPTKWFSIGPFFRAERPQRGRLREHVQLNVDIIGDDSPAADAEVIAVAVRLLDKLGFTSNTIQIKINDRGAASAFLIDHGVPSGNVDLALDLIDKLDRLSPETIKERQDELEVSDFVLGAFGSNVIDVPFGDFDSFYANAPTPLQEALDSSAPFHKPMRQELDSLGIADWCRFNTSIVRGLAYYTGTVFEIHEASGKERAIAGGGRYDNLVELFGGPPTPACGFAMGDVVLRLVLEDHDLLKPAEQYMPAPDVFVITARDEEPQTNLTPLISELRQAGLHVRHSYKATRNVGKLMSEANKAGARFAVILGKELDEGNVVLKDLRSGEQEEIARETLIEVLRTKLAACEGG
ncbi:MAG: histidine--tRNA ligase [Planctomycetes bacterium]|nr:histidine--tRNA ligase [Planctomycetota bacterium]